LIKLVNSNNLQIRSRNAKFIIQGENPMSENQNTSDNQNEQILALLQTLTADLAVLKTDMQDVKLRVGGLENNLVHFGSKLQSLEQKLEERLQDTRPIWQAVLERLDKMEAKQEKSDADSQSFRVEVLNRLDNLEKEFRVYRRQEQLQIGSIIGDVALVEERVEKIEAKLTDKNS